MRKFMVQQGFDQVPQLSSERFLNLSECFMPEVQPQPDRSEDPAPPMRAPNRKAISIGINYLCLPQGHGRLSGCINDSETMIGILRDTWGFQEAQIRRLRDDRANMMPTKANMVDAIRWLVQGASSGDELFMHYSGHGGQQKDKRGDEKDGKDETIIPCDFQQSGMITDDDLHMLLVDSLPAGVRLWVIMDCCHSGTALDMRYKVILNGDGSITCKDAQTGGSGRQKGEVIMISGCKDSQTSADVSAGSLGVQKAAGAMTTAFRHTVNQSISCHDLLINMRSYLKRNGFDQVPQMSSDKFVQLDCSFIHYQERKKNKRSLPPCLAASGGSPMPSPMGMAGPSPSAAPMPGGYGMTPGVTPAGASMAGMSPMGQMPDDPLLAHRINALENEIAGLKQSTLMSPMSPGPMGSPMPGSMGMTNSPPRYGVPYSPGMQYRQ
jgi:hypothetical protein